MKRLGITITDKNLLKSDIKNLKKKLVDHGVLIIKKQKLNNKKLIKFSKLFGQPIVHNFSKTIFLNNIPFVPLFIFFNKLLYLQRV